MRKTEIDVQKALNSFFRDDAWNNKLPEVTSLGSELARNLIRRGFKEVVGCSNGSFVGTVWGRWLVIVRVAWKPCFASVVQLL